MIKKLIVAALIFISSVAHASSVNGRWTDFYEAGDSVRIKNGVSITAQKEKSRAGAFIKTGLWTWNFENKVVTFKIKMSDWSKVSYLVLRVSNGLSFVDSAYANLRTIIPANSADNEWIEVVVLPDEWVKEGAVQLDDVDTVLISFASNEAGSNVSVTDIETH